jgi:hypothetical protein
MFNEPNEDPAEPTSNPTTRAKEKSDEFRVHAELAAAFEGNRKFDAGIYPGLDAGIARDLQRAMAKLEKSKTEASPVIPETSAPDASTVLNLYKDKNLSTNDYHIHRRPGETMIVRWLAADQVQTFYERLQAHFDAALTGYREEEHQQQEWKQEPETLAYLKALDDLEVKMEERYLRPLIKAHKIFVLSNQSADEMNIAYLCDYIMGIPAAEIVGPKSAPPEDDPTEGQLAWFFKLYSLRGMVEDEERMCFFTYLQKSDDIFDE